MRLLPKQENFYTRFVAFADLLEEAAAVWHTGFKRGSSALKDMAEAMIALEHRADVQGMELFTTLHTSFLTPFDPEDIFALIHELDDVMDGMEDVAHRAAAYHLVEVPETMVQLSGLIYEAVKAIRPALLALQNKKDVIDASLALKEHDAEIDRLTRQAIARLFVDERDALVLMKKKEIYEYFEATGDACAHVATVLGRIHIKGG